MQMSSKALQLWQMCDRKGARKTPCATAWPGTKNGRGKKSSAIVRFVFILPHNVLRFSAPPPRHVALKGRNGARCHPSSGGSRGKNLRLGRGHGFCIPWEATHDSQLFFFSPHLLSFLSHLLAFSTKQVARCPLLRCALPCHLLAYGSGCHDCFHEIRIPSLGNTSA